MTVVSFASHPGGLQTDVLLLMRHGLVRRILAARHLVAQIEAGDPQSVLKGDCRATWWRRRAVG